MIQHRFVRMLAPLVVPVTVGMVWWFASANNTSPFYPPLRDIIESLKATWMSDRITSDILPSLQRLFVGYFLAIAIGTVVGALLGRIRILARAFGPTLEFSRAIPATALVPLATSIFGIGDTPKILLITFVCVFPILLNTMDGVRSVGMGLEDVGRTFRIPLRDRIFKILLPSAAPRIFAGMRISLAFALIMMIVTEMVAATNGIGFVTLTAQQRFQIPQMWAGMLLLGILGAVLNLSFMLFEKRILRWHYQSMGR